MGKGLKAALKSQQSRLKEKEKAQKAAKAAELKGRRSTTIAPSAKFKAKEKAPTNQKPTIPFSSTDAILLIGEGNFSFARALAFHPPSGSGLEHLPPRNITATAYDSEEECYAKYPEAKDIVESLRERGVEVLFNVDATKLEKTPGFKRRKWDRVVWNFPHAGESQCMRFSPLAGS
jgi:25S rRNA (uracil2634-N3)-methyltransferase